MTFTKDYHVYQLLETMLAPGIDPAQYAKHENWRVRYGAAIAMGEKQDPSYVPVLLEMLKNEDKLDLYSQPQVKEFIGGYDDTRMAEMLVKVQEVFDKEYPDHIKEAWKCRGRVRHAAIFALYDIGVVNEAVNRYLCECLERPNEDFAVCAAAARTLGKLGNAGCIPSIERGMEKDEWCLRCEGRKAIAKLSSGQG